MSIQDFERLCLMCYLVSAADLLGVVAGGQGVHRVGVRLLVLGVQTRMVDQEILELVTVGVHARLLAQTRRLEEGEGLERSEGGLALGHGRGGAGH